MKFEVKSSDLIISFNLWLRAPELVSAPRPAERSKDDPIALLLFWCITSFIDVNKRLFYNESSGWVNFFLLNLAVEDAASSITGPNKKLENKAIQ